MVGEILCRKNNVLTVSTTKNHKKTIEILGVSKTRLLLCCLMRGEYMEHWGPVNLKSTLVGNQETGGDPALRRPFISLLGSHHKQSRTQDVRCQSIFVPNGYRAIRFDRIPGSWVKEVPFSL